MPPDLYDAIEDDEALGRLADSVAHLCGARSANIVYGVPGQAPFQQMSYFPDEYVPVYLAHFADKDPWRIAASRLGPTSRAISMDRHVPPERFLRTDMYNELLRPLGDDTGRCMGIERAAGQALLHIAVHRPLAGRAFTAVDQCTLEKLFGEVAAVLRTRTLIDRERSRRMCSEQMVEAIGSAVLIVDSNLAVLATSHSAEACLERSDGLSHRAGKLCIAHVPTADAARDAVGRLVDRRPSTRTSFLVPRPSGLADYRLFIVPAGASAAAGAAIVIDDPAAASRRSRLRLLADAYQFTQVELNLLEGLLGGSSLADIADARQVSVETVRTQLKSIFNKTGTNRQVDLVALLS